jgi:hypothetical protein
MRSIAETCNVIPDQPFLAACIKGQNDHHKTTVRTHDARPPLTGNSSTHAAALYAQSPQLSDQGTWRLS